MISREQKARQTPQRTPPGTTNHSCQAEEGTTTGTGTAKGGSLAGHGVVQFTETPGTIVFYVILGIAGVALMLYLLVML